MPRREHFFFLAFAVGMIAGWILLDQVAGDWFARQGESASVSQLVSLCMLKFALALAAGGLATVPYVFVVVDGEKELKRRVHKALLTNYSAFVTVGVHTPASRLQPALGNQFRPPRHIS